MTEVSIISMLLTAMSDIAMLDQIRVPFSVLLSSVCIKMNQDNINARSKICFQCTLLCFFFFSFFSTFFVLVTFVVILAVLVLGDGFAYMHVAS